MRYNKKRNSLFLFEVLTRKLTESVIKGDQKKSEELKDVVSVFFSEKKELGKEFRILKEMIQPLDDFMLFKPILIEARKQYGEIDKLKLNEQQSGLISLMNKEFGKSIWSTFVPNYKTVATIHKLMSVNLTPKQRVLLENNFKESLIPQEKEEDFPKTDKLVYSIAVKKMNKKYESLNESQRKFIKHMSMYEIHDVEMKDFISTEISRVSELLGKHSVANPELKVVAESLLVLDPSKKDDMYYKIIVAQGIAGELTNAN